MQVKYTSISLRCYISAVTRFEVPGTKTEIFLRNRVYNSHCTGNRILDVDSQKQGRIHDTISDQDSIFTQSRRFWISEERTFILFVLQAILIIINKNFSVTI